jgi:hypothetical protein
MSCYICEKQRTIKITKCYICSEETKLCIHHKKYNVCQKHYVEFHKSVCSYNCCDGLCEAFMGYEEPCEMRCCNKCLKWFLVCKEHDKKEECSECYYR